MRIPAVATLIVSGMPWNTWRDDKWLLHKLSCRRNRHQFLHMVHHPFEHFRLISTLTLRCPFLHFIVGIVASPQLHPLGSHFVQAFIEFIG